MTDEQKTKLKHLRELATSNWGNLLNEEMVKELRALEHLAAVEFAKKHGMTLHVQTKLV